MPLRLTFLIRDLGYGGAQRQMVALARGLALAPATGGDGFEVTVVHFYDGPFLEDLRAAGVRTVRVLKRGRWDLLGFFLRLVKAVRTARPRVLHGYLNEGNLMAALLRPLCGNPKVVWGVRDSRTDAHQWGVLGRLSFWLNRRLANGVDIVILNSEAGRDYYAGQGYPAARMEVVANGIDTAVFSPDGDWTAGPELRREWGAGAEEAILYGIVGRLDPMKDHPTFLRAAALVAARRANARFVIIGSGGAEHTLALQVLAADLGLRDRVCWSPARDDMPGVFAALDVVVSTSAFGEGFSNVLAEAMACARPCVATQVGDAALILGEAGLLAPAGDAPAVAAAMLRLAELGAQGRAALGEKARARVLTHFSLGAMVGRARDLIQQAASARRVTFVTTGLGTGGAEMMLWQLLSRMDRAKVWPSVISLTAGGKYAPLLRAAGVAVESLDLVPGEFGPAALLRLRRCLPRLRPGVLVGWMYHGCLAAMVARLLGAWGAPVLWSIRQSLYGLELEKRGSARVIRLLAPLSRWARAIVYNSAVSAGQHEALGYAAAKRVLAPNGFDLSRWRPATEAKNGVVRIGRFGRYAGMKDYPTFLEAAALIAREAPRARFVLAGTQVDAANAELRAQLERLGLTERVELLGERHDMPELTAALDIAVSSSAFGEGFPNVVGEAMACAVPVVATDVGDTAAVLGDAGIIVPARDPAALARACLDLMRRGPEERQALGARGRGRVQEMYSLDAAVRQWEDLLATGRG